MKRYTDEEIDKMYGEERQKKTKVIIIVACILLVMILGDYIISMITAMGTLSGNRHANPIPIGSPIIIVVIIFILYKSGKIAFLKNQFQFTDVLHDIVIPYCVQDMFGEDASFEKKEGIPIEWIKESHLVGSGWNLCKVSNLVKGNYMGLSFMQSDVKLVYETEYKDSDGNTHSKSTTVFEGPWAVIDFKKPFSTNLIVRERGEKLLDKWVDGKSTVEMESIVFNEKFIVIAEDAHNAFYLLTPTMMELILRTEKRFQGRIYFCFMDGKIHIAIDNGKNCFAGIQMANGVANARKEIYGRLSLVPELMKQMDMDRQA